MTDGWYPPQFNFGADVVDHIARTADGPALIWANDKGEEARFLYSDMARLTSRLAASLRRLGVSKGDRVLVMLPRIPEWQLAMVACLKLGAVPIPCIEMLTAKDIAYRLQQSEAVCAIARASQVEKFAGDIPIRVAVGGAPGWEDFAGLIDAGEEDFEPATVAAEDPAILYFTSGSTGQPKGVLHAARGLYLWRHSAITWLDLRPGEIMWCTADTGWSKAGTSILFGPWSVGACSFFYDGPFDAAERLRLIAKYGVTVYCAPATELLRVVDQDVGAQDLSTLRRTVSAGEALSPVIAQRWRDRIGHDIAEGYGQTEHLISLGLEPGVPYRAGSTGKALSYNDVRIVDERGRLCADGEEGEIALRTPNPQLMLGYWRDPERTENCYVEGPEARWFLTGDRGMRDADGYVYHRGRNDDIIGSAGYRIGPSEVEDVLLAHSSVAEAAVVGAPDPERGEIVMAYIVLRDGFAGDAQALQNHVRAATAPYKYPRAVRFIDALPKTLTGKIQRNVLREQAARERSDPA